MPLHKSPHSFTTQSKTTEQCLCYTKTFSFTKSIISVLSNNLILKKPAGKLFTCYMFGKGTIILSSGIKQEFALNEYVLVVGLYICTVNLFTFVQTISLYLSQ